MRNKLLGVISLGCSKNRLDTEGMLYALLQNGFEITQELEKADLLIVNTCSFIQSAKEESIEAILQAAEIKAGKKGSKLLVTGCLPERYREELVRELPEVDAFVGVNQYGKIVDIADRMFEGEHITEFIEMCIRDRRNRLQLKWTAWGGSSMHLPQRNVPAIMLES